MSEAFLTHVRSAQEAIEKKGSSRSTYKESSESYACPAEIEKLGYSGTFASKRDKFQQLQRLLTEITRTSGHTGTFIQGKIGKIYTLLTCGR